MFILDVVADDYESFERIRDEVMALGARAAVKIEPLDVHRGLTDLIAAGLLRAYRLSPTGPAKELEGVPQVDEIERLYYWLTDSGRVTQLSDCAEWPFDENGNRRNGWQPPID
jgi:hypothetical protein